MLSFLFLFYFTISNSRVSFSELKAQREALQSKVGEAENQIEENNLREDPRSVEGFEAYWRKLKNALPCFREFLSAVYQARFQRDDQLVACSEQGSLSCANASQVKLERQSDSLVTEFRSCLMRER